MRTVKHTVHIKKDPPPFTIPPGVVIAMLLFPASAVTGTNPAVDEQQESPPASEVQGLFASSRSGLELQLSGGLNVCSSSLYEKCSDYNLRPGFGGGGYIGARIWSFLGAGIDWGLYSFRYGENPDASDVNLYTMHALIVIRIYLPFKIIEPYFKIGFGYQSLSERGTRKASVWDEDPVDYKVTASAWTNGSAGIGLTWYAVNDKKIGDIGFGANGEYNFIYANKRLLCIEGDCVTKNWEEGMINAVQINVHASWVFPLF